MENASKALIIAGAILLAILIIGIGMFIFNNASDSLNKSVSRMSEQERMTFNQRFLKYEGVGRSGTDTRSLIEELVQNYSTQVTAGEMARCPGVTFQPVTGTSIVLQHNKEVNPNNDQFVAMKNAIRTTRTYDIVVTMSSADGIVTQIAITEK